MNRDPMLFPSWIFLMLGTMAQAHPAQVLSLRGAQQGVLSSQRVTGAAQIHAPKGRGRAEVHGEAGARGPRWHAHRARDWRAERLTWRQRGGYDGYTIPDARFSLYFGPRHTFRIGACVEVDRDSPRFYYQGYWFRIVDPWPEVWIDDWYDTDEVYIAYEVDGYYLYNRRYPGVALALTISR